MFTDPVILTLPGKTRRAIHMKETLQPPMRAQPLGVLYTVSRTQYSCSLNPCQTTENANHFAYSLAFSKVLPGRIL